MSATATILSEVNDLAKDYYSEILQPLTNVATALKAQRGRLENFQYTGRKVIFSLKMTNGGGVGNVGSRKTLPEAKAGTFDQAEARIVRTYARMAVDLFDAERTKAERGSYRPLITELMDDRMTAINLESNRQGFSAGDGKIALIGGTPGASATQTFRLDYAVTNGGNGVRHIVPGDFLAIYDNTPTLIGRRTVSTVDPAAQTVTFTSSITTTATTNFVTKSTADTDNFTETENLGLLSAMVQTGTFQAVPIGGHYKAKRVHNSGTLRPITDPLVMQTVLAIKAESGELPTLAITRPGVTLNYSSIFLPIRRINGQDVTLKGGYNPVAVIQTGGATIPVLEDVDCPDSRMFFENSKYVKNIDLVGTQWADKDGAQFRQVNDQDAIEGYIRQYWGTVYTRPNALGVLEDLEDVAALDRIGA